MKIWKNSKMTTFYYSNSEANEYPCSVKITEYEILVEYEEENGKHIQYKGKTTTMGILNFTRWKFVVMPHFTCLITLKY